MPRGKATKRIEVAPTESGILVPVSSSPSFTGSGMIYNKITGKVEFPCVKKEVDGGVAVYRKDGTYIRTYTLLDHGEKYAILADEFIMKKNSELM